MNLFGINIQRSKTLAATMASLTAPQSAEEDDTPESVKFGRQYQKGASREMLHTLEVNARAAERNSKIALYLSIPHQALYLLGLVALHVTKPMDWAETGITVGIALGIPYLIDQLILMNIRVLATRAASTTAKVRAGVVLGVATPASMFLNFSAPGSLVLKYAAAGLIVLVALYQIARSARPDFARVGEDERKLTAEVEGIRTGGIAPAGRPARSRKDLDRRKASAVAFAQANPNVTAGQLAKQAGIGRDTAKRILAGLSPVPVKTPQPPAAAPTSPGMPPVGDYASSKA